MGVGFPQCLLLDEFGSQVWAFFGDVPYHVGSSVFKKRGWRDVDVRVIMDDEEWDKWEFGDPTQCHSNGKWVSICRAYSELGKQMTGLPIDFQVQKRSNANSEYGDTKKCPRSAIGLIPIRYEKYKD